MSRIPLNLPPPNGTLRIDPPPLRPLSFLPIAGHASWRPGWTHIVAGRFSPSAFSGLLCYDQAHGLAAFYETDGIANLHIMREHDGWRSSWTHVVAGQFGDSEYSGLLLYDQQAGTGAIYTTDGHGEIIKLQEDDTWRTTWTHVVVAPFADSRYSGVLLYDQSAGFGAIYSTDGQGRMTLLAEHDNWRTTWTHIVAGEFFHPADPTKGSIEPPYFADLFFYEGAAGYGETYVSDGKGGIERIGCQSSLPVSADIVAGNFGAARPTPWTNLLFLDRPATMAQLWAVTDGPADPADPCYNPDVEGLPRMTWGYANETLDLGGRGYDHAAPGNFWVAGPEDLSFTDGGFTDLLFYDSASGTADFYLKEPRPAAVEELAGYASPGSVRQGESLTFHVSSTVGPVTVDIYRRASQDVPMGSAEIVQLPGPFPIGRTAFRDGARWPATASLTIPPTWPSGLYVARVAADPLGGDGVSVEVPWARVRPAPGAPGATGVPGLLGSTAELDIPFVVRCAAPGSQAAVLIAVPDTTYEAYNEWGGRSLYGHGAGQDHVWVYPYNPVHAPRAFRVSFRRPFLTLDRRLGSNKWQFWEVPFLAWLERLGITAEVCTMSDLHRNGDLLQHYRVFVSLGHDEYWSREMRTSVEDFIGRGGNVMFLSGNVCYWQARFEDDGDTLVCYKDADLDPNSRNGQDSTVTVKWADRPVSDPEARMIGVTGANLWDPPDPGEPPSPFACFNVEDEEHWVFADTGLSNRDAFGLVIGADGVVRTVIGPETDAIDRDSPDDFKVLGTSYNSKGERVGTMGIIERDQSSVFTAATIDWVLGLSQDGGWNAVDQITLNVLKRMVDSPPT